jgi:hypothetical protein
VHDEGAVGRGRHPPDQWPEVAVLVHPEMGDGPERHADRQHALELRGHGGLPVDAALEAVLGRPAVEEAARPEQEREGERGGQTRRRATPLEPRAESFEPTAAPRRHAEREQDHVLREHRELDVNLLRPDRDEEMRRERAHTDRQRSAGDLAPAQPPPDGRPRLATHHAQQRIAEREHEQRLEEPGRAGRQMPHLFADERPEPLGPAVVLAIRDVLERRAQEQRVAEERNPQPDQTVLHEARSALPVVRRRGEPARDEKEQPEAEQPADAEQGGDRVHRPIGHLFVGLEVPGPVQPVGDRRVHRDHPDDEQDLDRVEVGQPGAHRPALQTATPAGSANPAGVVS